MCRSITMERQSLKPLSMRLTIGPSPGWLGAWEGKMWPRHLRNVLEIGAMSSTPRPDLQGLEAQMGATVNPSIRRAQERKVDLQKGIRGNTPGINLTMKTD